MQDSAGAAIAEAVAALDNTSFSARGYLGT